MATVWITSATWSRKPSKRRAVRRPKHDTVFADRRYPQRFGCHGETWFLPLVGRWCRALDRREAGLPR